jgi:tRNA-dihydrouridine synthase
LPQVASWHEVLGTKIGPAVSSRSLAWIELGPPEAQTRVQIPARALSFTYHLAPLEDTSDSVLRSICHKYGADVTYTEMARFDSLSRRNASTWEKIAFHDDTPAWVQIVGSDEQRLKRFLSMYEPPKGFLGINFNLGCPAPQLVGNGLGCAMVKRIAKTTKLVKIVQDRGYPCSVKMRLGLNRGEKEKKVYLNLIDAVPADFFVVHARVGSQTYEEPADYGVFPEIVAKGKTIIANGDIHTSEQVQLLRGMGVKGVMIGRAAVRDPAIFNRLKGLPAPSAEQLREEYSQLAEKTNSRYKYRENVLKRLGKPVDKQHYGGTVQG